MGRLDLHPLQAGAAADPGAATMHLHRAESELAAVPSPSTYWDNARYYLGRSLYEEPAALAADRIPNLDAAVAAFTAVIGLPGPSSYALRATYWRGRSHHALAFLVGNGAAADAGELDLALVDLRAVAAASSTHADNALYYVADAYLHHPSGPYCAAPRGSDPVPASACQAYGILASVYPASPYVARASDDLLANGCDPAVCP